MPAIDDLALYDQLAAAMNGDPVRYELLGDLEIELAIVMHRPDGDAFRALLGFTGINCSTVAAISEGDEANSDCWLEGDLADWQAMFDHVAESGHAMGEWTLNTLTIMGERIKLQASDPMGWDKFHRFNQTLQEFFDASASMGASTASKDEASDVRA